MHTRRLAYEPRATLAAAFAFTALTVTTLRSVDVLVLTVLLGYVALSSFLPRPAAFREAASRHL